MLRKLRVKEIQYFRKIHLSKKTINRNFQEIEKPFLSFGRMMDGN
jgi:hypothetical protein